MDNKSYILSETISVRNYKERSAAVVINLYYMDSLDKYIKYIDVIPSHIHIYIFSSSADILKYMEGYFNGRDNIFVRKKENRGRDVSALLVAFREQLLKYDYLCFLHDKKEKNEFMKDDIELWIKDLWDNMIKSSEYISNILDLLDKENIGLLVPPKPMGYYVDTWYTDPWKQSFEVTLNLAQKLKIRNKVNWDDADMVTIGTVFWCKTKALGKLFEYGWKYTDFPEEPMPNDATVSHAIERILGYVAVDAGYEVGTVMCSGYASDLIEMSQTKLKDTYDWLWKNEGIKNSYQLKMFDEEKKSVDRMFAECDRVFLYGAGHFAKAYLERLSIWGYKPYAFVVSDGRRECDTYWGYKVYELREIGSDGNFGFILCTNPDLQQELADYLETREYFNYCKATVV
jgi:rhamnosyltransferase